MSVAIEAKDKEIKTLREGQDSPRCSTRRDRFPTENEFLYSDIEALREQLLKTQEDLDMTTRNRNELEYEIQALQTTLRKNLWHLPSEYGARLCLRY